MKRKISDKNTEAPGVADVVRIYSQLTGSDRMLEDAVKLLRDWQVISGTKGRAKMLVATWDFLERYARGGNSYENSYWVRKPRK